MSGQTAFQIVGIVAMIIGVLLFTRDHRTGENTARAGPFEFKFSAPSLTIVAIGAILFALPFTGIFHSNGGDASSDRNVDTANVIEVADPPSSPTKIIAKKQPQNISFKKHPALSKGKTDWVNQISSCDFDQSVINDLGSKMQRTLGPGQEYYNFLDAHRGIGEITSVRYVVRERYENAVSIQHFLKKSYNIAAAIIKEPPDGGPSDLYIRILLIGDDCPTDEGEPPERGQIVKPAPPQD